MIDGLKATVIVFVTFLIVAMGTYSFLYYNSIECVDIYVTDKERFYKGDTSHFLIYTEDEVFKNEDSLIFWKFDSADMQRDLTLDTYHTVRVAGWRIRFLSEFRNIIDFCEQ